MNSESILIGVLLLCIFVLALVIRILVANRRKERTEYIVEGPYVKDLQNLDKAIKDLIGRGKIVQAIKLAKETKNISLREAKEFVERYTSTDTDEEEGFIFEAVGSTPPNEEIEGAVTELLMKSRKLEAIKMVKEELGIGLKEAKDYVEEIEMKLNL